MVVVESPFFDRQLQVALVDRNQVIQALAA